MKRINTGETMGKPVLGSLSGRFNVWSGEAARGLHALLTQG